MDVVVIHWLGILYGDGCMVAFLLEVGTEELPASFVDSAMAQWQEKLPAALTAANLQIDTITLFGTPRRLGVLIEGLPENQPDQVLEIKGPPVQVAYQNGELTPAGLGFLRKQGLDPKELKIRETDKGSFVFALQEVKGQPTAKILETQVISWITSLSGERLMRWGHGELKFPRPIRWLVALFGDQILPMTLEGIQSDRITQAHRVLHSDPVVLGTATDYSPLLSTAFVQPDREKRLRQIEADTRKVALDVGGIPEIPAALLQEVTQLVEWPTAVLGTFDSDFLALPIPVIKIVMITHQRYFPVYSQEDPEKLLPYFVTISNGDPTKSAEIAAGNSRVVRARLADAQFFYQEDQKQPLALKVERLGGVTFVEELGSMRDKVARIQQIAQAISQDLNLSEAEHTLIERTAFLSKADLVTQMVYEFPELQGFMGSHYAECDQEAPEVVEGIAQQYWPLGSGDPLPTCLTAQVIGISDRIDTLVGLFALGRIPTGSSDRFALRRAANSILLILWQNQFLLSLEQLVKHGIQSYAEMSSLSTKAPDAIWISLRDFFWQRIQTLLQEDYAIDYDLVNATLGSNSESPLAKRSLEDPVIEVLVRAQYLQRLRQEGQLQMVYPTLNRIARLAQQGELGLEILDPSVIQPALFQDPVETTLFETCQKIASQGQQAKQSRIFNPLIEAFADATPVINQFFEAVLVMDKDPAIKANRLTMLGILRNNAYLVADFAAVVMAGEPTP